MSALIDTHCHLYSEEFTTDIDLVIARAEQESVEKFYMPGIDGDSIAASLALEERFPGKCIAMMGLHPCYVKENYKEELDIVENWLQKRRFAAVGEIGLDFYWDKTFVNEQYKAFEMQIEWALQYNLPIVIHTRNAMQETIDVIKKYAGRGIKGIFHCFSGNFDEAKEIIEAGFLLGIGGVITYKNSGLAEVIGRIPMQHLVLETDAPYLTPVPFRGKRNESSYLRYIAAKLAEVKKIHIDEVVKITTENALNIFS